MIVLNLPRPVSVNGLFFNKKGKGRVRTDRYNAWRDEAGWMLKQQRQKPLKGPVNVQIAIADEGSGDLDNFCKAALDLLVLHGMIEGDGRKVVRNIQMQWSADVPAMRLVVQPA